MKLHSPLFEEFWSWSDESWIKHGNQTTVSPADVVAVVVAGSVACVGHSLVAWCELLCVVESTVHRRGRSETVLRLFSSFGMLSADHVESSNVGPIGDIATLVPSRKLLSTHWLTCHRHPPSILELHHC